MPRRRTRTGLCALLVATAVLALPTAAAADTRWFHDPRGDTRAPSDVVLVSVTHGDRVVVRVHHRDLTFRPGSAPEALRVSYGVPGGSSGPDFTLRLLYQSDAAVPLRTATGWGTPPGPQVPGCGDTRVTVDAAADVTKVSVRRACLGNPARVRAHVRVGVRAQGVGRGDDAPDGAHLGPWVAR